MANYVNYLIKAGTHETGKFAFAKYNQMIAFKFTDSCIYDETQIISGWNKLWGFTSMNIHANSVRIAWAYDSQIGGFKLASYCYVNSIRIIKPFEGLIIQPNQEVMGRISWYNNEYIIGINGTNINTTQTNKPSGLFTFQCWPYFGGQSVAPHDMTLLIKKLN